MKILSSKVTLAILLMLSGAANADDDQKVWLTTGFLSHHVMAEREYREVNTGIGIEYQKTNITSFVVGRYHNSFNDFTNYAGVTYKPYESMGFRGGITITILDGYRSLRDGKPFLAIEPTMSYEYKNIGANFLFLPTVRHGKLRGAFAVQLKFSVP